MSVSVTIRDVPGHVRNELAARAARSGRSLQQYLRSMLVAAAERPPVEDVIARAHARARLSGTLIPADHIIEARDADRR